MNRSRPKQLRPRDMAATSIAGLARALVRWPVETQLGSRRNALLASTRLTEARRERRDVEDYLARLDPRLGDRHEDRLDGRARAARERGAI